MDSNLINELYPTTAEKVGLLIGTLPGTYCFFGALNSARKGEFDKAIFKALLWAGMTNNINASVASKIATRKTKAVVNNAGFTQNVSQSGQPRLRAGF